MNRDRDIEVDIPKRIVITKRKTDKEEKQRQRARMTEVRSTFDIMESESEEEN